MDKGKKVVDGSEETKGMKYWDEIFNYVMRDTPSKNQLFRYSKFDDVTNSEKREVDGSEETKGIKNWEEIERWVMRDCPSKDQCFSSFITNKAVESEKGVVDGYEEKKGMNNQLKIELVVPDTPDQDPDPAYFGLELFSEAVIDYYSPQSYGFKRGLADSPSDFVVRGTPSQDLYSDSSPEAESCNDASQPNINNPTKRKLFKDDE